MEARDSRPPVLREFAKSDDAVTAVPSASEEMSLDALRGLERIHHDMCAAFSRYLSDQSGQPIDADVAFTDQGYIGCYSDYLHKRSSPGQVYSFSLPPLEGRAVVELRGTLAEVLTRTLADQGGSMTELLTSMLRPLQAALSQTMPVELGSIEPQSADVFSSVADGLAAVIGIQVDRPEWWLTFCYPKALLVPLLDQLAVPLSPMYADMTETGSIILLNGTSSSGKTTLAKALQKELDQPYMHASLDGYVHQFPEPFLRDKERLIKQFGQIAHAFHAAVAASAHAGVNVIVDHVLSQPAWLEDCVTQFADLPVLFVGVKCPLPELERRETDRGDRAIGLARGQFQKIHAHGIYDLEVDTDALSREDCAALIAQRVRSGEPSMAFEKLRGTK